MNMDIILREFVATGDIAHLSISGLCDVLAYARMFAPSLVKKLEETQFFNGWHV